MLHKLRSRELLCYINSTVMSYCVTRILPPNIPLGNRQSCSYRTRCGNHGAPCPHWPTHPLCCHWPARPPLPAEPAYPASRAVRSTSNIGPSWKLCLVLEMSQAVALPTRFSGPRHGYRPEPNKLLHNVLSELWSSCAVAEFHA